MQIADFLLTLPRWIKRFLVLAGDAALCLLSVWVVISLRHEDWLAFRGVHWWAVVAAMAVALPLLGKFGLYRTIFHHSGSRLSQSLNKAFALFFSIYALVFTLVGVDGVPRIVGVAVPPLLFALVALNRVLVRFWLGGSIRTERRSKPRSQVLIYGAGSAGCQLANALAHNNEMVLCGFLDDSSELQGNTINGLPVYDPDELDQLVLDHKVTDVLLAIPSASRARRMEILRHLQADHLRVLTLPGIVDLAQGRVQINDLRELEIEDLLGRDPVNSNGILLHKNILGKVVMVTGAGGSIGSELCRQIVQARPATLLLVEHNEFGLYAIEQDLRRRLTACDWDVPIVALLASVRREERMSEIMSTWKPHTVYHAAAYKHVPLVEKNPAEGIRNNVLGTLATARAAQQAGVADFVLISTDKAVRPTNIMGASKRLAEMVLQGLDSENKKTEESQQNQKTRFSMVRFGNVLGSSGSVVPLFQQQIKSGGPIELTHLEVTRYFMTVSEAVQLVIQAGAMASGGDVFVLDMGEPVRIADLARRMVELSGLTVRDESRPDGDIALQVVGLRPGEKLYEELLIGDDPQPTPHPLIMKAQEVYLPWDQLDAKLALLTNLVDINDVDAIRTLQQELVHGYQPADKVVDWVYVENEKDSGT